MKSKRCICGRYPHSEKRKALEVHLSGQTCDVYGCSGYSNSLEDEWTAYKTSQRSPVKYYNKPSRTISKTVKNDTILKYFLDCLAKSSINGISNCTSSRTLCGKLIWFVVFVLSISGFSYQASHFYQLYKNKPSVVQIEVENDGEVDFPAVTVCNTNRIRRSAYCERFSDKCISGTLTEYEINEIMYNLLLNKKEDIRDELGHTMTIFSSCDFIGTPTLTEEDCLNIWEVYYDPDYGNCYTFTSKTKDNVPLQARKVDFWQEENDLTLVLDSEPEEFMEKKRVNGFIIIIHDEKALPDMHTEGILVTPGNSYTITAAKSTVLLLPAPYKTNCTDYTRLPWQKMHKRRLTSRLCTVGCSQYFQFEKCQYVTKNLSLFYKSLPYEKSEVTEEKINCSKEEERRTIDYCRSVCGLPCRETLYSTTLSTTRLSDKELNDDLAGREGHHNMSIFDDIIYVRIFYSTLEHKIFRHIPKYDTMELFSFLGGYSGVWLGFSLLTIYELLEIIVSTIIHFFRKKRHQKQNRKLLRKLVNSRKQTKTEVKMYKNKKYYG